jgi:hypothetical protein
MPSYSILKISNLRLIKLMNVVINGTSIGYRLLVNGLHC